MGVEEAYSKEFRHASASKADAVGVDVDELIRHCQWKDHATFRKFYKRKLRSDPPKIDDPKFGAALRAGSKRVPIRERKTIMTDNVKKWLSLTFKQINPGAKSSEKSLKQHYKLSDQDIDACVEKEISVTAEDVSEA